MLDENLGESMKLQMPHFADLTRRKIATAVSVAIAFLLVLGVFLVIRSAGATHPATVARANATTTPTVIASATATVTPLPTNTAVPNTPIPIPTSTPKPHPLPAPKVNAPPPADAGSTHPAPTAQPTVPTATPCTNSTACAQPTPGACKPGGSPYYVTPTVTPTTDAIAATISGAASRNGIPVALQDAIAWQESGWQENIVACDAGIGLMQLMPATVTWLNNYYGVNDDPHDIAGNAALGAGYLSFYYKYYTSYLQQNAPATCGTTGCNWDTVWPGDPNGTTVRDIVISVYNEGAGTMSTYGIINWSYVSSVLNFFHNRYGGTGI